MPTCTHALLVRIIILVIMLVAGPALQASGLNNQEQAIADYMVNDLGQKRPFLKLDPILSGVARSRAQDMASRNYFSDANPDGLGANHLVRKAGYVLPDGWGNTPLDNSIESIAAGYSTPKKAWDGWMNAKGHRAHILGLIPFYAEQTSYGVGYHYDANSTHKYYWVILTAPPIPAPKLAITTPASGTLFTTSGLGVVGTVGDPATTSVEVRIENAAGNGVWHSASGVGNWSTSLSGFASGANTIRARSLNSSGTVIAEVTSAVNYQEMGLLTVNVSGSGTTTAALTGTTSQQVGKSFTIIATPAAGNLFSGWSGDVASKSATLTFTMQKSFTLQASFVPNYFPALSGLYTGLITTVSNGHNGFMRITSGPGGAFTGQFQLDGIGYRFLGQFGVDGRATVILQRPNASSLVLNLQLATAKGANEITGTISDGIFTAGISADRAVFNATTKPAPQAGYYTVVLASNPALTKSRYPHGNGFANVSVDADGKARIAGVTADGAPFTLKSMVAQDGQLPVYVPLYAAKGWLAGALTFKTTTDSDLDGTLNWMKPQSPQDAYYRKGFAMTVPTVGSRYTSPAAGARVMDFLNGTVELGNGNLRAAITQSMTLSSARKIAIAHPNPHKISFTVNPRTGMLVGSFVHPADHTPHFILGVVLQKQNAAYGFFDGVDQYGYMTISPTTQQH